MPVPNVGQKNINHHRRHQHHHHHAVVMVAGHSASSNNRKPRHNARADGRQHHTVPIRLRVQVSPAPLRTPKPATCVAVGLLLISFPAPAPPRSPPAPAPAPALPAPPRSAPGPGPDLTPAPAAAPLLPAPPPHLHADHLLHARSPTFIGLEDRRDAISKLHSTAPRGSLPPPGIAPAACIRAGGRRAVPPESDAASDQIRRENRGQHTFAHRQQTGAGAAGGVFRIPWCTVFVGGGGGGKRTTLGHADTVGHPADHRTALRRHVEYVDEHA